MSYQLGAVSLQLEALFLKLRWDCQGNYGDSGFASATA